MPEARVPVPRVVEPSVKVTVPVGAAVPEAGVTVAVKVRLVPLTAVVAEAARVVVVAMLATGGPTVTVMVEETLPRKVVDPAKPAVMLWDPMARAVVEKVALPVASTFAEPRTVSPSLKRTAPVGVVLPVAGATVAVKVTLEPWAMEVAEAVSVVVVLVCVTMVDAVA